MTALYGYELEMLARLLEREEWDQSTAHRVEALKLLSQLACMDGKAEVILAKMAETTIGSARPCWMVFSPRRPKVTLKAKPGFLGRMVANRDIAARERFQLGRAWP